MSSNGVKPQTPPPAEDAKKMGFFDSVLAPPEWLNECYVEKVLGDYEKDQGLKITNYSITTCTKPGDNFVGVIFRAQVSYTTQGEERNESFIVKIEPFLEGFKKDLMANQPFFRTEGRMYTEILPVMQELLKNSGDPEIIAPGLIHYCADPKILIFKDLSADNFVMQHMPVDYEKASVVAKKLGKFHALSWYLREEQGESSVVNTFKDGFFSESLMQSWDFISTNISALAELTKEWGPEMQQVSEKLAALKPELLNKLMQLYKPNSGRGISVLNHGDFHIRNLLFRYDALDKDKYDAIQLIDFQLSVYASPAIDLSYLLYMIAGNEAREEHRNQLLATYHEQFTRTLSGLGFLGKVPALLDFQVELLQNGIMEYFVAANFLTLFYMDHSKLADIDFTDKSKMVDMVKDMFNGPELKSILLRTLPQLMYKGVLDV